MKFICTRCGRADEVIGDTRPLCLFCGAKLIPPTDSYEGLLMNPSFIIDRMNRIVGTYGLSEVHSNGTRFKRDREAWTTAIFALGQTHLTGKQYWVEIETKEQTPDTRIHYIDQSTGRNNVGTGDVEVIDWDDHVEDPLELVRGKCRKAYPGSYTLLILGRSGKRIDGEQFAQQVQALDVPFAEIWILGLPSPLIVNIATLYPEFSAFQFNILDALGKLKIRKQFLMRQKRGTTTVFEDLGEIYLPLP